MLVSGTKINWTFQISVPTKDYGSIMDFHCFH